MKMGLVKLIVYSLIYITVILLGITFLPGIPPHANKFSAYRIELPKKLHGNLALNDRLNDAEILFKGQVKGAETLTSYGGELYTGGQGGYVVRVNNGSLTPIVKFGGKCDGVWQESKCGRPLGMKFDKNGSLYVCDAYYGLFKVDVKAKTYEKLVDSKEPIDGQVPMIVNSVEIADNGDVYWSDSSADFSIQDGIQAMLTDPSGRLIRYNAATKENEVLVKNLGFANGVALGKNEEFVIVMETGTSRIVKYHLKGAKAGKKEIFIEGLPGLPDNVHSDNADGFLVSLVLYADDDYPQLSQQLVQFPALRRLAARLLTLLEAPFKCFQCYYPNPYTEKIIHFIGDFESVLFLSPKTVTVLRINGEGKIVDAAYNSDGLISGMSSAYIHDQFLWLGSPWEDYIARVPLKQAFPDLSDTCDNEI